MGFTYPEYLREWKKRNPEKVAAYRAREVKNPAVVKRAKEKFRIRHLDRIRREDAEAKRKRRAARPDEYMKAKEKMKLTYAQKREREAGRPRPPACEICSEVAKIVFDHCHKSGDFRGWICDRCNKVLGLVYDSPILLRQLQIYLEGHGDQANIQSTQEAA